METESGIIEYKSLLKITKGDAGFDDLAKTCVCLANAQGGRIYIGFDDKTKLPPKNQIIQLEQLNKTLTRVRSKCFNAGVIVSEILVHQNGGQYFILTVLPSQKSIATTSDGKIFIRIGDECQPVRSEDLNHIAAEKDSFQWEVLTSKTIMLIDINQTEVISFTTDIRNSPKVSEYVKNKTDKEILEYYNFIDNDFLTNLGILWLGHPKQRARLSYPLTVQYIVYDEIENKVRKKVWHDYQFNPKSLVLDIEKEAVELTYFHELPKGMFRESIRLYPEKVIRELLINAIAHKSYTISGDIFINIYPDRLEITSPGGLPTGVTKNNILHERRRRNPLLINVFHDIGLMEGEGSGYDMIYEVNSLYGKSFPEIISEYDHVSVIQEAKLIDEESLQLISYITQYFSLTQKEKIALGVIVRHRKISSPQLSKILQMMEEDRLRSWISGLISQKIVITRGMKKGTEYLINPKLISSAKIRIRPSLITIEPHRLQALIEEDLKIYPWSSITDISKRLVDVKREDITKIVYSMVSKGILEKEGAYRNRKYNLAKKK